MPYYKKEYVSGLLERLWWLEKKLAQYEGNESETSMKKAFAEDMAAQVKKNKKLQKDLENAHEETRQKVKHLEEVINDLEKELEKEKITNEKARQKLVASINDLKKTCRELRDKCDYLEKRILELEEENEILKFDNKRMSITLSMSSDDSSLTSHYDRVNILRKGKKKPDDNESENKDSVEEVAPLSINEYNNRKYGGNEDINGNGTEPGNAKKKQGGQKGHPCGKILKDNPDKVVPLDNSEFENNPRYIKLGQTMRRQFAELVMTTRVTEYTAELYYDNVTGAVVHAPFPEGVDSTMSYDETMQAFALLETNYMNSSVKKTHEMMKDMCGGVAPSTGCISNLSTKFAGKTKAELNKIIAELKKSPYIHVDFTFAYVGKEKVPILMILNKSEVCFIVRDSRGYKGIEGTLLETYNGIVICDGEYAFTKYGTQTQQCWAHILRYLNASIENEKELKWATKMRAWAKKAIHYRNEVKKNGQDFDEATVSELEKEYDEILELAEKEYEKYPPKKYFTDGYDLYKRLCEKEKFVLFLHNILIEPTNNLAEREARQIKRKLAAAMCFRSRESLEDYCKFLSVVETWKFSGENVYEKTKEVLARPSLQTRGRPRKNKETQTDEVA